MKKRRSWRTIIATCLLAAVITTLGAMFGEVQRAYAGYGYGVRGIWNDEGNENKRPESVTFSVLWGGKERAKVVLRESTSTLILPPEYPLNNDIVPPELTITEGGTVIEGENMSPWVTNLVSYVVRAYREAGENADKVTCVISGNAPKGYEVEYDHYLGEPVHTPGEDPVGGFYLFGEMQVMSGTYTNGNKLESLRGKLRNAIARQPYAERTLRSRQSSLTTVQNRYNEAKKELDDAKSEADAKKAEWDEAQKAVTKANADVDAAQSALDKNAADIAAKQKQIPALETDVTNAQNAKTSAQQRVNAANTAVQTAQVKVDAAQADVDAEVDDPGTNAGHKEWTAYGFFQHIRDTAKPGSAIYWDAQCAMDILDGGVNTTNHSYPHNQGPEPDGDNASAWSNIANSIAWNERGDAVSLDNMRTSLEFLREFNSIRAEENAAEGTNLSTNIGTNLRQMAISIVQCDASKDYSVGHTQAYEGLENLSWSSGSGVPFSRSRYTDPYVGWYDEEKKNYKQGSGVTGHYETIVDLNSNYFCEIAGFAVCSYGASYGECRELSTFGDFTYYDSNPTPEVQYSVDELASALNTYYDAQVEAGMFGTPETVRAQHQQALADAQTELNDALSEQSDANDALTQAQNEERDAQATLTSAKDQLQTLQNQTSGLQQTLANRKSTLEQKKTAASDAKSAYEAAEKNYEDIKATGVVANLEAEVKSQQADVATEQQYVDDAHASLTSARENLDAFTDLAHGNAIEVAAIKAVTYNGKAQKPKPVLNAMLVAGKPTKLVEGTDYTISYSNNTNAGTATVIIKGKGSKGSGTWWGTRKKTFIIKRAPTDAPKATNRTYNGKAQTGVTKGAGYTLSGKSSATNAGPYKATATPDKNHCWKNGSTGGMAITWKIVPASITKSVFSNIANQAYTGKAVKTKPTLKLAKTTLKFGTDYTLSYKNNVKAGIATVIATGKGNYTGSAKTTFKIVAPRASYYVHVQGIGDQKPWRTNGEAAGTFGESRRLEAIYLKLGNGFPVSGGIQYKTHIQGIGWQEWRANGAMSGTSGESRRLEAIQIRLTGEMAKKYDVYYRVHAQKFGWMGWAKNGNQSGTAGYSYRLEAIQVVLVPKGAKAPAANYKGQTQMTETPFAQR